MEQFITEYLMGQEIEVLCVGGGTFAGIAQALEPGVLTLEWKDKQSYIATAHIVAAWRREDRDRNSPSIGFGPR